MLITKILSMKTKLLFLTVFCFCFNLAFTQTLGWNSIGVNDFNQATCGTTDRANSDMALSPSGMPYVAFNDWANGQRLSVRRYNGTDWEYVGNVGLSSGSFTGPRLAFDNTGNPYVVFSDGNNSSKLTVLKFNGSAWVVVGTAGFTNSYSSQASITIDANNTIYVGYYDTNLSKMSCQKFNGTSWSYVGTAGFTATGANNTDIAVDATGNIYFKYGSDITKYNGSSWSNLPKISNSYWLSMTLDNSGQPCVAFDSTTASSTSLVRSLYYNGSAWVNSGTGTLISKPLNSNAFSFTKIHFGKDNKLYVGFGENIGGGLYKPYLYVNSGSGWSSVQTSTVFPFKNIDNYPYLSVNNSGQIYFGTSQTDYNYGICIYKYANTTWLQLGNKDVTGGQLGNSISMAFAPNGTVYVAEVTGSSSSSSGAKLAVKKFNGTIWDTVGATNFNYDGTSFSNRGYFPKIKINSAGDPYVSYTYGYTSYTANVRKFNGTAWVNIGPAITSISTNVLQKTDIDFLPNDTLVALTVSNYYVPTVSKYNGTSWVNMGGAITSPSTASTSNHDLAVDPLGNAYLAYVQTTGTATLQGLYVKKYTGGSWQTVGTNTVAAGIPGDVTLKFDATGTPFVAYTADNGTGGRKANVKKFDGVNWVSVGPPNFTSSTADLLKMEIDNSGKPIVIYQVDGATSNFPNNFKLVSMQFNGTSWSVVGGASHSAANITETLLEKNPLSHAITEGFMVLSSIRVAPSTDMNGTIWVKEFGTVLNAGIKELNSANNNDTPFLIYPNPTNKNLTIVFELLSESATTITITNTLGQIVLTDNITSLHSSFNVEYLESGIYFVNISDSKGNKSVQKIIKE